MIVALNIVFWVWCAALALFAILTGITARDLSAEAGGAGVVLLCAFTVVLLVLSLLVRGVIWLL